MHSMLELPEYMKRAVFIAGCIIGIFLLIGVGIWGIASCSSSRAPTAQKVVATPTTTAKASPLVFGTNLNLLNNNEARAAISPSKQAVFESLHLRTIRLSIPPKASTQAVARTAQYIHRVGATPLVSLQGRLDNDALADDIQVVKVMNQVFGQATVYYEYGNEDDAQGVSAENYTTSWNTIVPRLKQVARQGQFVGPVTYHYDQRYLQTFLQRANPQPNEVSWHEFTCDNAESKQQCLSQIGTWNQHIAGARTVMRTVVGKALPIMISEWNYSENPAADDGKSNDTTFMTQWTSQALQTLASNNVFASMLSSGSNTSMSLINDDDTVTAQGAVLQSMYEHLMSDTNNAVDPTASPTDTASPSSTPTANAQSNNVDITPPVSGNNSGASDASSTVPPTPTATPVPPTATSKPTATPEPPTPTPVPPTSTPEPPTPTLEPPTPTPMPQPVFADRSLVKAVDNATVYVVYGGAKFAIPSPAVFNSLGFQWAAIQSYSATVITAIPNVPRDGTMLKEQHTAPVYLIQAGAKCHVLSANSVLKAGGWSMVKVVPDGSLATFPPGSDIP